MVQSRKKYCELQNFDHILVVNKIARFHYLTQDLKNKSHVQQVQLAIDNGVQWIQLRSKSLTKPELRAQVAQATALCQQAEVQLIINDHVDIALSLIHI